MNKFLIVARHEYFFNLKQRSFLLTAFGIPLFVILVMFIVITVLSDQESNIDDFKQIGYVDLSNVLNAGVDQPENFAAYPTEDAARTALDDETINAYFVLPENYLLLGEVSLYSYGGVPEVLQDTISDFILANLAAEADVSLPLQVLQDPVNLTTFIQDSGREISRDSAAALILTPFIFVFVFIMAAQLTSGFLMSGIVEEKTNRIMEILVTSVTPLQMLLGKVVGLGLLGMTQLVVWLAAGLLMIQFNESLQSIGDLLIPADLIIVAITFFILTYFLMAALMTIIGVITGSEQESRQYAGIISLIFVIPFFLIIQYLEDPHGTMPVALTLFPFTAGVSILLRMSLSSVPLAEIGVSIVILLFSTLFLTWAAGRIFRWASLMYGKKLRLREVLSVLRGPVEAGTTTAAAQENS